MTVRPSRRSKLRREDRQRPGTKQREQRGDFERDRDRLLYTDALRRLAGVTQVAGAAEGHLFHNRLTHTLKVAQIARRLAEKLHDDDAQRAHAEYWGGLNADVVEAAALVHDLGHPPFGHIAEEELDRIAREHGAPDGFEGNAQSFRIVTRLAAHRDPQREDGYVGLNLTRATLNAALKYPHVRAVRHPESKAYRKFGAYDSDRESLEFARALAPKGEAQSLEAAIMDYADDVAYSVHDLEDFFRAGLIPIAQIAQSKDTLSRFLDDWCNDRGPDRAQVEKQRESLELMLRDLFPFDGQYDDSFDHRAALRTASSNLIQRYVWAVEVAPAGADEPLVVPAEVRLQLKFLQRFVWKYVIEHPRLATQQHGQRRIIRSLFDIYLRAVKARDVALVPPLFHRGLRQLGAPRSERDRDQNTPDETRLAVDIVASFSDAQAVLLYRRLTGIATGSVTDYLSA